MFSFVIDKIKKNKTPTILILLAWAIMIIIVRLTEGYTLEEFIRAIGASISVFFISVLLAEARIWQYGGDEKYRQSIYNLHLIIWIIYVFLFFGGYLTGGILDFIWKLTRGTYR